MAAIVEAVQLDYPVTYDDIQAFGTLTGSSPDILMAAAKELVAAVDDAAIAEAEDIGFALILASDYYAEAGDLETAEQLAMRAIDADDEHNQSAGLHSRIQLGVLRVRLGREEEALEFLRTEVCRNLDSDDLAAENLGEALVEVGRADLAVDLLTPPAKELAGRLRNQDPASSAYRRTESTAREALRARRGAREALDLPHDTYDELADELTEARNDEVAAEMRRKLTFLYWPAAELERLARWPELAREYPDDPEVNRAYIETQLAVRSEHGWQRLAVYHGSVDEMLTFGDDAAVDDELAGRYLDHAANSDTGVAWPPERNAPCWCGSGMKYKKCCRPRRGMV